VLPVPVGVAATLVGAFMVGIKLLLVKEKVVDVVRLNSAGG
jgi:hypothetical protein